MTVQLAPVAAQDTAYSEGWQRQRLRCVLLHSARAAHKKEQGKRALTEATGPWEWGKREKASGSAEERERESDGEWPSPFLSKALP